MLNPFKSYFSHHFCHLNPSIFPAFLLGESPVNPLVAWFFHCAGAAGGLGTIQVRDS